MRAWELNEGADELGVERFDDQPDSRSDQRNPTITLRHINRLKKIKAHRRAEQEQRHILMGLMYGVIDENEPTAIQKKQDQIDLRKKEQELKKIEQEIKDADHQWMDDLHRMAKNGINRAKKEK